MTIFDFSVLYDQYPAIISWMPPVFDSHQFIIKLAQQNQVAYIKALSAYMDPIGEGAPAPFQVVHGILAKKLKDLPELVTLIRVDKPGIDIFGNSNTCAEWRKVNQN